MLDQTTDILNRNVMLPERIVYLTRQLRDAKSLDDAANVFGIAEQILSDALGDLNVVYSNKLRELNKQRSE